tara:strand:- start:292 stop:480 length:189 start_codon:yes stop_codon:yes gene_type:complete
MVNSLQQRLEDFSKTKSPRTSGQYTIAVDMENKQKFQATKKRYHITTNELMRILLEGVNYAK